MEPYAHSGFEASLGGSEIVPHDAYAASTSHADLPLSPDLTQDYSLSGFQGLDGMPEMAQGSMQDYASFHPHNHVGFEADFNGINPAGAYLDYGMPLDHLSSGIQHAEVFQGQEDC